MVFSGAGRWFTRFEYRIVNNRFLFLYVFSARVLLSLSRALVISEDSGQILNWQIITVMVLLLLPAIIAMVALESGLLFSVVNIKERMPYRAAWRIIWSCTAIIVTGEIINQCILVWSSGSYVPAEAVRIGMNVLFSIDETGRIAYLFLAEITPFSLFTMIILFRFLKKRKLNSSHAGFATLVIFVFRAGIRLSMTLGTG